MYLLLVLKGQKTKTGLTKAGREGGQLPFLFNTCMPVGMWKPKDNWLSSSGTLSTSCEAGPPVGRELTNEARLAAQQPSPFHALSWFGNYTHGGTSYQTFRTQVLILTGQIFAA